MYLLIDPETKLAVGGFPDNEYEDRGSPDNCVKIDNCDLAGLIKPKWDGKKLIEGAEQSEADAARLENKKRIQDRICTLSAQKTVADKLSYAELATDLAGKIGALEQELAGL